VVVVYIYATYVHQVRGSRGIQSVQGSSQELVRMCEAMTDNTPELSMGEMREICKEGIRLNTTATHTQGTISLLTCSMYMLHDTGLLHFLWAGVYNITKYVHNRTPMRALPHMRLARVLAHPCAFGVSCVTIEPQVMLKSWMISMWSVVEFKYGGGGYKVWDSKWRAAVESRCGVL